MDKPLSSISVNTALTILAMIAAGFVSYFTAQAATSVQISDLNGKIQVVQAKTEDTDARLDRIENKVDALLIKNGISPTQAASQSL